MKYRTIDGTGNNLTNPDFNSTGSDMTRVGTAHFADDASTPVDGPNPRTVSNIVVAGDSPDNPEGLSGMMYAWGQFIDHDLDLNNSDGTNHIDITIPPGDPNFAAGSVIALTRGTVDPSNGNAVNAITGWLDGSMVYGSDATTAAGLRTADGHLLAPDNNLPTADGAIMAGDVRAAENPSLTALQTLFVREHNYQVDLLHENHPELTGNQLYQQAKAITTAEIANITYKEFLPHLLGPDTIQPYQGYDPTVDPRITEEFAGAAYRFGHSIVSADLTKIDENGNILESSHLKDAFFESPDQFNANSGADGVLRHLASDPSQALDVHIVDDLRNFLSDLPDGQDLAAINIERGRDLGLGTLNQTRESLGLAAYTDFSQITSDPTVAANLETAYGSVDKVDLWSGGLAEDHAQGAMVGPTFQAIIGQQFENLRDGDRLWFENQGFDATTLAHIENTTLSDLIKRDAGTTNIQADAFVFTDRHSEQVVSDHPNAPQLVVASDGDGVTSTGGPAADTLVAGHGIQTLTGLGGNDTFVFNGPGHTATVTDFQAGVSKLEFDTASSDTHATITAAADGHAVVAFDGNTVDLTGVDPTKLNGYDFIIHHDLSHLTAAVV
jgi:peroxidase